MWSRGSQFLIQSVQTQLKQASTHPQKASNPKEISIFIYMFLIPHNNFAVVKHIFAKNNDLYAQLICSASQSKISAVRKELSL